EELLRELWPNTRVEPGSLKRAVLGARQALGDRGSEESSVRTVRGHGYQFARDVRVLESGAPNAPSSSPAPQPSAASAPPPRPRGLFVGRERVIELLAG